MRQNYSKIADLKKYNITLRENDQRYLNGTKIFCEEISKFYPAEVVCTIYDYENDYYAEQFQVKLKHDLNITVNMYKGKYRFHLQWHGLKHVTNNDYSRESEELNKPNQIGVLTDKKVLAWINYYESLHEKLVIISKEGDSKINSFLKSIEGLPVQWDKDKKSGFIIQNGIEFTFSILEGYVSQRLEIHYKVPNSVQSFKQLSKNNYKVKK